MRPLRSIAAIAIGVLLKKRVKRTSAARSASETSSPGLRLRTSVRVAPGAPSAAIGHAVEKPDRQALAVPLDEVEVDDLGAVAPPLGGRRRRAAPRRRRATISARRERPGLEAGEVDAEPFGERGVEVDDAAVRLGREEAGRRVVEIVDGVLQLLEDASPAAPARALMSATVQAVSAFAPVGAGSGRARMRYQRTARPVRVAAAPAPGASRQAHLLLGRRPSRTLWARR